MNAYQPVDPAGGLAAIRVPLPQLVGFFLCRRTRPSFASAALVSLIDEFRAVTCDCGARYDAQILTAERLTTEIASLSRSGRCPECRAPHDSLMQFQRNGLIISQEKDGAFVWLSPVVPNRHGSPIEEHLFWFQTDWSKRNSELALELNVPDEIVAAWRRKIARLKAHAGRPTPTRRVKMRVSRPRGSSTSV